MKSNNYKQRAALILSGLLLSMNIFAQTISDFENLTLTPNSHNDGSSGSGAFISGNVSFQNYYNSSWMYWESGFAYSNEGDTAVSPSDYMTQLYQTKAGKGNAGSANFAIGQQGAKVNLIGAAIGAPVDFLYVTNTTYAYNSMFLGDSFGKKFGDTLNSPHSGTGIHGSYPDWFKLSITGFRNGNVISDTVDFYLADYRFADNSLDYIVKDWQIIDLTPLGNLDSLIFLLSSSDNGSFGMNTPAYFCIDDFKTHDMSIGINEVIAQKDINVYPNPFAEDVKIKFENEGLRKLNIYNSLAELVYSTEVIKQSFELSLSFLNSGIYFLEVIDNAQSSSIRLIKK
jgi:hypothetical protein